MFYAIYMATRPRARACIFHKTLGLMLYLLLILISVVNVPSSSPAELPHIAVTYRQQVESAPPTAPSPNRKLHTINRAFMSLLRKSTHSKSHDLLSRSPKPASFHSYVDKVCVHIMS